MPLIRIAERDRWYWSYWTYVILDVVIAIELAILIAK